ncbi:hypothetical protein StoSoilB19_27350 [Arthrobacter sp. StoSoilB19]|nr:hypothetical protein StoSoilB19_27350 [Arthrobacter sp. StoSoilB19]
MSTPPDTRPNHTWYATTIRTARARSPWTSGRKVGFRFLFTELDCFLFAALDGGSGAFDVSVIDTRTSQDARQPKHQA